MSHEYKKKYKRREGKRREESKGFLDRPFTLRGVGADAFEVGKLALAAFNTESKFADVVVPDSITTTPSIIWVTSSDGTYLTGGQNNFENGTAQNNRLGSSIRISSIYIRQLIAFDDGDSNPVLRQILFVDRSSDGSGPTYQDVLEYSSTAFQCITSPLAMDSVRAVKGGRFKIIKDWTHCAVAESVQTTTVGGTSTAQSNAIKAYFHEEYIPLDVHTLWDETGAPGIGNTIADALSGHIFLLQVVANSATTPVQELIMRVRFVDN